MFDPAALRHPREQSPFAPVSDPRACPVDEGRVDVGIRDGRADGVDRGGKGNDALPLLRADAVGRSYHQVATCSALQSAQT
ncbi:hypothetical protein, partial [Sphingobium sp. ba1]|uniref:hypothetical protein n=1 Tax=Sphingobium sp. ba1 TaxID=1522072 RepID=UPI001ED99A42